LLKNTPFASFPNPVTMSLQPLSRSPFMWAAVILSISALSLAIYFSFYGFDFTDEGYYLNSFKYSDTFTGNMSLFGFVYSLPFRLLGNNIPAIRIFNILSLYLAGYWLIVCATRDLSASAPFTQFERLFYIAPTFASFALLGLGLFSTPSYNHLALLGCVLFASSMYIASPSLAYSRHGSISFVISLSLGLFLAFAGKPTTGVALCLILSILFFFSNNSFRRSSILALLICITTLIIFICLSLGGPASAVEKISFAKEVSALLDEGHNLQGLAKSVLIFLSLPSVIPFSFIIFCQFLLCSLIQGARVKDFLFRRWIALIMIAIVFSAFYGLSFVVTRPDRMTLALPQFWIVALPVTYFLAWIATTTTSMHRLFCHRSYAFFLLILMIPAAYGFGTNTGIWSKALSASVIYISLAVYWGVHYLADNANLCRSFIPLTLVGFILASPSFLGNYILPQRQPQPLWMNRSPTAIGSLDSKLLLDQSFSNYIEKVRFALAEHGFRPGDPMLDLTGRSPGLVYAVSGRAVGHPWIVGGYKGSGNFASAIIRKTPDSDLSVAWILDEPSGPRRIEPSILKQVDIDLTNVSKYKLVATFVAPNGAGGVSGSYAQRLYKRLPQPQK